MQELAQERTISNKDTEIAILKSQNIVNDKITDLNDRLTPRFNRIEEQLCQQRVINSQVASNLNCLQKEVDQLYSMTSLKIKIDSVNLIVF